MVIFASEDIGLAQPTALGRRRSVFRAVETIGLPECLLNLAHGVAYLANCAKDRSATNAIGDAMGDAKRFGNLPVPMLIRERPDQAHERHGLRKRIRALPGTGSDAGKTRKARNI